MMKITEQKAVSGFLKIEYFSKNITIGGINLVEFLEWEDGKKVRLTVEVL